MFRRTSSPLLPAALGLGLLTTSLFVGPDAHAYGFDDVESDYQDLYLSTPVRLTGRVVDEFGMPLDGASVRLIAWGDNLANDGAAANAWAGGIFTLEGLARRNAMLEVSFEGYYGEIVPISLQVPIDEPEVDFGEITLVAQQFGRARVTFAGDAMFDRRMYSSGVLQPGSLASDTRDLFRYVEDILHADDHTAINLETPVTSDLSTPHPTKAYVFAAAPAVAAELPGLGVDSAALGNNHIYDYLDIGVVDTLAHLDNIGLPYYGAGTNRTDASLTTYRPSINGLELSLQSFSNFIGSSYGGDSLKVIAYDYLDKPGALPSYNSWLDNFVDAEVGAGRFTIPVLHGGSEYELAQSSGMHSDFERVVEHGAGLVVAHHPHVAHGVSVIEGSQGPTFVFGSLGNFVFDQDVWETMRSYLARVDLVEAGSGVEVEQIRLIPIRLDDYAPRPLAGAALERMGRDLAHLSTQEASVSGFGRAVIFAESGQLVVVADEDEVTTTDLLDNRVAAVEGGSTGTLTLDPFTGTDALAGLRTDAPASCEIGRDLLHVGDFEELDVDDEYGEPGKWVTSSSRYLQGVETHGGTGAAVLLRKSSYSSRTSLWMGNRLEVQPNHKMTIRGWHKGNNAGEFRVTVRWMNSSGSTITHTTQYQNFDGDFDWTAFDIDVTAPANADSLKVYFRHYPPAEGGDGELFLDDVQFIDWDPTPLAVDSGGTDIPTPNAWDAVRCSAADGDLDVSLVHRVYETPN